MAISSATFIRDTLFFIKTELLKITDPLLGKRSNNSKFVMTSYPQRLVEYPLITIKLTNQSAAPAGMQVKSMDVTIELEIRTWGRNQKEKDELSNDCFKHLRDIQFTASTGSIANNLHNFRLLSSSEIDEPGEGNPKSRILNVQYNFFNV